MTYVGFLYARYQNLPWQKELRGAMIGFTIVTIAMMASLLIGRPANILTVVNEEASVRNGLSEYEWSGSLTNSQQQQIQDAVKHLPNLTIAIIRSDSPDCIAMSDAFAAVFQDHLIGPPFTMVGLYDLGLTLYAPQNPDPSIKRLQTAIANALNYSIELAPLNPAAYIPYLPSVPDLALSIGSKKKPSFFSLEAHQF